MRSYSDIHNYKLIQTLHWNGLVCRRCGNWVGTLSPPGGMIQHHMPSRVCAAPVMDDPKPIEDIKV